MGGIYRCVFFMYIIFVLRNNNLQFYYVYRDWRQLSLTTTCFCHNHLCIRPPNPSNTSTACFHSTARVFTTIATRWAPAVQHHLAGWFIPPCRMYIPVFPTLSSWTDAGLVLLAWGLVTSLQVDFLQYILAFQALAGLDYIASQWSDRKPEFPSWIDIFYFLYYY